MSREGSLTFACDMTAISPEKRGQHHALIRRLMTEAAEISELPSGLAFRFPAEAYDAVTEFVGRERLCCPFLTLRLEVSPDRGPIWLRLTGPVGVKEFIRAELQVGAKLGGAG